MFFLFTWCRRISLRGLFLEPRSSLLEQTLFINVAVGGCYIRRFVLSVDLNLILGRFIIILGF